MVFTAAGVTFRMSTTGMTLGVSARITRGASRGRMGRRSILVRGRRVIRVGMPAAGITRRMRTAGLPTLVHGRGTRIGMRAAGVARRMHTAGVARRTCTAGVTCRMRAAGIAPGTCTAGVTCRMRAAGITPGTCATGVARGMYASRMCPTGRRHGVVYRTSAGPDGRTRGRVTLGAEMVPAYPVHRGYGGPAMVGGRIRGPVGAERVVMVKLFGSRLYVVFARKRLFLRRRLAVHASRAVKACAVIVIDDHGAVYIGVVDDGPVYVDDRGIVPEVPTGPFTAVEPGAAISIAIVNTSVVSYVGTPIPAMPSIDATGITPVTRGPQIAGLRRGHPNTGYPIIPVIPIRPVTGGPDIIVRRTVGLYIYGNRRGSRTYRNAYG